MRLIEKIIALIGLAFVIALTAIALIINIIPILSLLLYCLVSRKDPKEIVELVLPY